MWWSMGDILKGQNMLNFDVEWLKASDGDEEEGLAIKGSLWGKEGLDA
jgi:hypothetical protein